jgi:hypothetical protein
MPNTTKVNVPKGTGDEISIRYSGDDPIVYSVKDGHTTVDNQHLDAFLAVVPGSKADTGTTGSGDKGES